jgi:hypothetical protein
MMRFDNRARYGKSHPCAGCPKLHVAHQGDRRGVPPQHSILQRSATIEAQVRFVHIPAAASQSDYRSLQDGCRRSFRSISTCSSEDFPPTSSAGRASGGNIPCRGVPQTGHDSAFKVISAPQHAQKAATSFSLRSSFSILMNAASVTIRAEH